MGHTRMVKLWKSVAVAGACLGLLGCAQGTTVQGTGGPSVSFTPPPPKLRTAKPSPSASESRIFETGPEPIGYQTKSGTGALQVKSYSWQRTKSSDNGTPPKQAYLILDVEITAQSTTKPNGTFPVNPTYLVAATADGSLLQPTMGADGAEPVLSSKEIKAGEKVGGLVSYDLPPEAVTILVSDELGSVVGHVRIPAPTHLAPETPSPAPQEQPSATATKPKR